MRTYGLGIANNDVEHTLRDAGPVCQLSQRKGSEWRCLCRLQDDLCSIASLPKCPTIKEGSKCR